MTFAGMVMNAMVMFDEGVKGAARGERAVAAVGVDEPGGGRLDRQAATEEGETHDEQRDVLDDLTRDVRTDQERHPTAHSVAQPFRAGRDGEDERAHQHEARDPRGQQRRDDRSGHAFRRMHHFLGDVAGRLEAVEDVDVRQDGHERRP